MMLRFLKSRGARKFRKNRIAMAALGVIGAYVLLTAWIVAIETADYIGKRSGGFTLQDNPVLGFLLPDRTLERVGPPTMAGFGLRQSADRRTDQYDFMLNLVRQGLLEVDSLNERSDRTPEQVLARVGMAERRLAAKPIEQIRDDLAEADALFARMDALRRKSGYLNTALFTIDDKIKRFQRELRETDDRRQKLDAAEDAEEHAQLTGTYRRLREDLSFSIEEITFAISDYAALADPGDPLVELDLLPLEDSAMSLLDPEFNISEHPSLYDEKLVEQIRAESRKILATLRPQIEVGLDEVEPVLARLFPQPAGFDGFLYQLRTFLGTDRQGRSIFIRGLYSGKTAIQVGVITALIAVTFGSILGAAAAFYGRWVDHATVYLFSVFTAIPDLVLLVVLAFMFQAGDWSLPWDKEQKVANTLIPIYAAFALTFWIGACRVIRGEAMKIKELEYIQAARAIGFGRLYILLKHLIPNTTHLIFISFSLLFVAAIKGEVVLTFLGLGLKEGSSWGIMISQSQQEVVNGFFWQIGAATFFMLILVLAFNIVSDALQDAFDPRHVG
jgi:ABC-type dipeptide/oligopeptide/nickel transport system permease subunit